MLEPELSTNEPVEVAPPRQGGSRRVRLAVASRVHPCVDPGAPEPNADVRPVPTGQNGVSRREGPLGPVAVEPLDKPELAEVAFEVPPAVLVRSQGPVVFESDRAHAAGRVETNEITRMATDFHAAYWAHRLSVRGEAGSVGALSRSIGRARVDLNPHQVDAALFAVRSPFSRGVILADEVGLGKTIEAGIVLTQRWAERRRRVLLVVPATLRKQWQGELDEKFGVPSVVLDGPALRAALDAGDGNPLERDGEVVVVSYPFAARYSDLVRRVPWDLVVCDEAHRLRNVWRTDSRQAAAIKNATAHAPKLLLTATPLQNSLLELYGLVSVLDDHAFGDLASFREQFVGTTNPSVRDAALRKRLAPYVARTLRRQVLEYVRFTRRVPLTQSFTPTTEEQRLYDDVSAYLQRGALHALPSGQRALMTLVLRKLLASSTFAIAGTLRRLAERLDEKPYGRTPEAPGEVAADFEAVGDLVEEWDGGAPEEGGLALSVEEERAVLVDLADRADAVRENAKGEALLRALPVAFDRAEALGAARKAVVFTESRRTQRYLFDLLEAGGYGGEVVCINGDNREFGAGRIYADWRTRHEGTGRVSGARSADVKAALVEEFRDRGTILLATESAAEGVNLQFCSLVVNYDLPWNPQRVEQRIGRCHRYGQKHDVVVVNFLNEANAADRRVFELLSEKFELFDGVFGASDEVLGALESGVDLERRIAAVYQSGRTNAEIEAAFDRLQAELDDQIQSRMRETRTAVLDHFDQEVHDRLQIHHDEAQAALDDRARDLLRLTRHELDGEARFDPSAPAFDYTGPLAPAGRYALDWRTAEANGAAFYHADHPLAAALIARAKGRPMAPRRVALDLARHPSRMSALEGLRGRSGWLTCDVLRVSAKAEDEFLLVAAVTDDGTALDAERARLLLEVEGAADAGLAGAPPAALADALGAAVRERLDHVDARNARLYEEEATKLDRWADDLKVGLEAELKDLDREIREVARAARAAVSLREKLDAQKAVRSLERRRAEKRRSLYDSQDDVDRRRDALIRDVEAQLEATHQRYDVFKIAWALA